MSDLMNVVVSLEDSGREITLQLTQAEYDRAAADKDYLDSLVSAASAACPEEIEQNDAMPTLPVHEAENSDPNKFIWQDNNIYLLLTIYEEKKSDFDCKRHKKVFDEIAYKMNETNSNITLTGGQCQSKIHGLKKTYKKIIDHNSKSGNNRVNWVFFERMDQIFGTSGWVNPVATASEAGPAPIAPTQPQPKKRKLESVFSEYFEEKKKLMAERNVMHERNNAEKMKFAEKKLLVKQQEHREKIEILKALFNNNNN